jgi:chaperonin cofactor prefoldin
VIYKLVGPVLVKQELGEGKETVEKRLVYCEGEL